MSRVLPAAIAVLLHLISVGSYGEISIEASGVEPELYWVVGSFENRQAALTQSDKLSRETGMEVLVAPATVAERTVHRLLISAIEDVEGRHRQRRQLNHIGIDDPWMVLLDPFEPDRKSVV